ncbi:hypothetical protein [Croceivirga thetidis]|uniref:Uncharacterized protein n=1 Tax=Croceivirga thetidis TaxID=2721623 RepID=A0ABX1GPC8_9FLAO|nr:hypothetical protein [Croceivirga thetidis]NKI31775.1 hypothetical protein [Croceivirga thetidis]
MKKTYFLLLPLFFAFGCLGEDCDGVSCLGQPIIAIELIQNNTNVLEEAIFILDEIALEGENTETFELTIAAIEFLDDANQVSTKTVLFISNSDWEPIQYDLNLELASDFSVPITTDIGLSQGDCCGGIPLLESLAIDGEAIPENELYNVHLVELN